MSPGLIREQRNQIVRLLNADQSEDLEDKTLLWERMIRTCEEHTGQVFAEDIRTRIWLSNAPESDIKTHGAGTSCSLPPRDDLVCARALGASVGLSPTPMDIGSFSLVKGNGKGKNGKGVASCEKCGKSCRTADQCLQDHVCSTCGKQGRRQVLVPDSIEPHCSAWQARAVQTQVFQSRQDWASAAICLSKKIPCCHRGRHVSQCRVTSRRSLLCLATTMFCTVLTCSDVWLLAQASVTPQKRSVTLDVDQIWRPLVLRGMVADVRKPLVSGLERRNAGWDVTDDTYGSVHRQSGQCANLLERAGVPTACSTTRANGQRGITFTGRLNSGQPWRRTCFVRAELDAAKTAAEPRPQIEEGAPMRVLRNRRCVRPNVRRMYLLDWGDAGDDVGARPIPVTRATDGWTSSHLMVPSKGADPDAVLVVESKMIFRSDQE